MDLIETVGARLVLIGQREYVAGMAEARKSMSDLSAGAKETAVASDAMRTATVEAEAAQKTYSDSTRAAVAAQQEYNAALKASAAAATEEVSGSDAAAAAKKREADARLAAATAARDAALTEVKADEEAAAAAQLAADKIEAAETRETASRDMAAKGAKGLALGVVAAAGAVAVAGVDMAAKFQSSTERLVSSAGETQSQLDMVRQGILAMAGQVGYSSDALATAMYKVESGGQHGAAGLQVLQAAAQGAKTENADLTTVADALTSALTDYHLPASAAADVTSKLVAATASGKMTFQELAGSMASILPVASANHVALNDVLGDIASMTLHGTTAQRTTQNLADAIRHMAAPTAVQSKEFAALGLSVQQVQASLGKNGLSGTINMISDAITQRMGGDATKVILNLKTALQGLPPQVQQLGQALLAGTISAKDYNKAANDLPPILKGQASSFATLVNGFHTIGNEQMSGAQAWQTYSGAMQKAMGDATGMNVALMIGGENAKNTAGAIGAVTKATADGKGQVQGFAAIQDTFNAQLDRAKAAFGSLAIQIGSVLLPALTKIVGVAADVATWLSQHRSVAIALAVAIGVVLVVALAAAAVALYGMAAAVLAVEVAGAPLIVIVLAVIAVVALLAGAAYLIISNWSSISGFFTGLWNGVKSVFNSFIDWVGGVFETAKNNVVASWNDFSGFFIGIWNAIAGAAKAVWEGFLKPVFDAIGLAARVLITIIITVLVTPFVIAFNLIGMAAKWLYENAIKPAFDAIKGVLTTFVNWVNSTFGPPIKAAYDAIGQAAMDLWNNYIVPAWNGIKTAVQTAWQWVNDNVIQPMITAWNLFAMANRILWNQYVVPAWNGIKDAINTAWQWINNNVFNPIKTAILFVGNLFVQLWNNYVVPAWNGIKTAINTAWTWIDQNVLTPAKAAIKLFGQAFQDAVTFIKGVWTEVEQAVATPIHWVVDVVYTNGIKAVWDKVADFTGLGHLPDAPKFAGGGVLGGYAPGKDTVHAMLSPGEAVLVPEAVKALGANAILALNAHYSGGRPATVVGGFAGGGIVGGASAPAPAPGGGGIGGAISGIVSGLAQFLTDPVGMVTQWLNAVFTDLAPGANTPVAQLAFKVPEQAVSALVNMVAGWFASLAKSTGSGGGAAPPAPAAAGGNAALVQQMAAARGWTGAQWNALYAVMMRESGFNNNAQNPTSTAYGMFQFLDQTWGAYGATKTSDPTAQTQAGLAYISQRYGTPAGALAHEQQYGWYSGGGVVYPLPARQAGGPVTAGQPYLVGERGPEIVIPAGDGTVLPSGAGPRGGLGGGTVVNVGPGAVVIHQASDPRATYEAVKRGIADAVARR